MTHYSAFRTVPKTGVIYVMDKAETFGYTAGNAEWANLGQGAAETGEIPECAPRLIDVPQSMQMYEYSSVNGIKDLRVAVADLYNHRYRQGKASQYTYENVAISSGGRAGLTRIVASLGQINLGHFIPDYTAYEELLDLFRNIIPIPIMLDPANGFRANAELLRERITGMGLGAILFSNPCNPTGEVVCGENLAQCVEVIRQLHSCLIIDEFYSHYHFDAINHHPISAAAYVEDVNSDQVIIIDGLSKNWRYPGLRVSWTVAPKEVIQAVSSAASFLDGGSNHPMQRAIIPLLTKEIAETETRAIQLHFQQKRKLVLQRLIDMGFVLHNDPQGGFYAFVSLENMPESLRDGRKFFKKALEYKVICVPGEFFDVDPGKRRSHFPSRLSHYIRISYGPPLAEVLRGLDALQRLVSDHR
ncbi:MAG: pyridoxal phosphate-dependent aminotransferase [Pseudomonadota bacterium]|nr:pyridoxal phosphate-dependent aminotransferase [Pseudomonadota bacterium]